MKSDLELQHVYVDVDQKPVVNDFFVKIAAGELHVLMGPNGSGKSSLAYALAGHPQYQIIDSPATTFCLGNTNLLPLSADERAKAGLFLVFQYPVAIPGLLVWKFLYEAYKVHNTGPDRMRALAFQQYLWGLAAELKLKPSLLERSLNDSFSGGEKKKLEILQMAVLTPKIALIDEVDSGLDLDAVKEVAHGIKTIQQKNNTGILLITHYQRILQYLPVDQVHIMVKGQLVQSGDSSVIQELERHGYQQFSQK